MAGRGRGRGRGMSINIEALGLGREEILPAVAHPPPLFPPLQFKPVPHSQSEELDYMLALKQELRESFRKSPFYVKAPNKVKDIERYSDKYQPGGNDNVPGWEPDWRRFPCELKQQLKKRKTADRAVNAKIKAARSAEDDVSKLLEKLEQNDAQTEAVEDAEGNDKEEEDKDKENNEDGEDEEEYDEEDAEEETDYNQAYFDNGEDYGDDDDEDDDEGPTY